LLDAHTHILQLLLLLLRDPIPCPIRFVPSCRAENPEGAAPVRTDSPGSTIGGCPSPPGGGCSGADGGAGEITRHQSASSVHKSVPKCSAMLLFKSHRASYLA